MRPSIFLIAALLLPTVSLRAQSTLVNASYDPTRELYQDLNPAFAAAYKSQTGQDISIKMSHGGSGPQAKKIIEGLEADIASLSVSFDIDQIANANLLPKDWPTRFPHHSSPYTSTVVFLVRKGNPKHIHDWPDLIQPNVQLLAPNPKTGGGARWIYLAAWGQALLNSNKNESAARDYTQKFYANMAALDTAMRGSTTKFIRQNIGDCLVGWENEILQETHKPGASDKYELIVPTASITIDVPIAIVDHWAEKHHTQPLAAAYVNYLFSPPGQEIIAQHFNRPRDPDIQQKYAAQFPQLKQFTLEQFFADWPTAMKTHFADGAIFDQLSQK